MDTTSTLKFADGNVFLLELLPNGFVRVDQRRSGLVSLYTKFGELHSGVELGVGLHVRDLYETI